MNKREFKKLLKEEYKSAKTYANLAVIAGIIFIIITFGSILMQYFDIYPFALGIILDIIIILLAIPAIIVDIKNDIEIRKAYAHYQEKKKFLPYTDKTKKIKLFILIELILLLIVGATSTYYCISDANKMTFTTINDKVIETEYMNFDGYHLKIPTDFRMLNDETIAIKYPNSGAPTLVYSNYNTTINIAFNENGIELENDEVEEYVEQTKDALAFYSSDIEMEMDKVKDYNVGHLKLVTLAEDTTIFNHMIFFSYEGELQMINFNCLESQREEWEAVSDFIFKSLKFE